LITIFTPTYNRAYTLPRLYRSLLRQTSSDFEWLIIDDGSTDDTALLVEKWIGEGKIEIRYHHQENRGKYMAHNAAVKLAKGEYFFTVDSDDWLPDDSVEDIIRHIPEMEKNNRCGGMFGLKDGNDKKTIKEWESLDYSRHLDLSPCGELSFIYKTEVVRKYTFPEIPGEKFVIEGVIYHRIDQDSVCYLRNRVLTINEYQGDGLTANIYPLMYHNPTGFKLYHSEMIDWSDTFIGRFNSALRYVAFKSLSHNSDFDYKGSHSTLVKILSPLGFLLKQYYIINRKRKNYNCTT
jgi:glycosyltransferase involved in cell wall biosynthesis